MITCSVSQQSELDLPFSEDHLRGILEHIFSHPTFSEVPQPSIISLVFIDDDEMQKINRQFRNIDNTTDVLSFELQENTEEGYLLGEILISLPKASKDAVELQISLQDEVVRLIVHGLAHLLGYDHLTDEQESRMKTVESKFYELYSPREGYRLYG